MSDNSQIALVIIPTYNEIENIGQIIPQVLAESKLVDVLVVDDNSPDGTGDFVEKLRKDQSRLHLLKRAGKLGLGTAYIAGFKFALERDYKYIFEMDADFSHNPKEINNFLSAIETADLVIGSRYIDGVNVVNWPLRRLLLSYFASVYTRIITRLPLADATGGYKCFRREVLETINLDAINSGGYSFQIEMSWHTWKEGYRIKEIPITFEDRTVGKSKMSREIINEAVLLVWKLGFAGLFKHRKIRSFGGSEN
jgi:dolichol-phosphate mannosyltransferase